MRWRTTGLPSSGRTAVSSIPTSRAPTSSAPSSPNADVRRFMANEARIAVLVPCYNEEAAIGQVIADFRAALPRAVVYVYDNRSADRTVEVAKAAGAIVRSELRRGKG